MPQSDIVNRTLIVAQSQEALPDLVTGERSDIAQHDESASCSRKRNVDASLIAYVSENTAHVTPRGDENDHVSLVALKR